MLIFLSVVNVTPNTIPVYYLGYLMLLQNIIRSATFDGSIYPEFKEKQELVLQSLATVSLTGIATAIGLKSRAESLNPGSQFAEIQMLIVAFCTIMVGWMMWSFVIKVICNLYGKESELRQAMRTTGIAYSPGILIILATIPEEIGRYILLIATVWILGSVLISIQKSYEISIIKSAIPAIIGWIMAWILLPFLMIIGPYFNTPPS